MDIDTLDGPTNISTLPARLNAQIDELSTALAPALTRGKWADAVKGDEDESPLARAKLDVTLAYTLVDLVWVYLQTRGIDPRTHPVSAELERVRGYYAKIRAIENPEQRRTKVDVPAAGRFISHAIPKSQRVGSNSIANAIPTDLPSTSAEGAARAGRQRAAKEQKQKQTQTQKQKPTQNGKQSALNGGSADAEASHDTSHAPHHVGRSSRFLKSIAPTAERVVPGSALAGSSAGNPIEYHDDDDDDDDDHGSLAGPSGQRSEAESDVLMFSGDEGEGEGAGEEDDDIVPLPAPSHTGGAADAQRGAEAEAEALWAEMQADLGVGAAAAVEATGGTEQSEGEATPTSSVGARSGGGGGGGGGRQAARHKTKSKNKRKRD